MTATAPWQTLDPDVFSSCGSRFCDRALPVPERARLRLVAPADYRVCQHAAKPEQILDMIARDIVNEGPVQRTVAVGDRVPQTRRLPYQLFILLKRISFPLLAMLVIPTNLPTPVSGQYGPSCLLAAPHLRTSWCHCLMDGTGTGTSTSTDRRDSSRAVSPRRSPDRPGAGGHGTGSAPGAPSGRRPRAGPRARPVRHQQWGSVTASSMPRSEAQRRSQPQPRWRPRRRHLSAGSRFEPERGVRTRICQRIPVRIASGARRRRV